MPGGRPREQSGAVLPPYDPGPAQQRALRDGTVWVAGAGRRDMRSSTLMNDLWLWPVTCRAHETRRADRVLGDPFASHLAASRGEERFGAQADSLASFALAVGAAIIDEVLQRVVVDHHIHTIAGLGAGLDTRPYRLELPRDLRWIEADRAPILDYKALRMAHAAPYCQVRHVSADLSRAAGRRHVLPKIAEDVTRGLVLTEALRCTWTPEALDDLLERLPPVFGYWIADTIATPPDQSAAGLDDNNSAAGPSVVQAEDVPETFQRHGWQLAQFHSLKEQAVRLGADRTAELLAKRPPAEVEGVWFFRRAT
jgi:O-methyltransferase involved in polyketide biosynthesis